MKILHKTLIATMISSSLLVGCGGGSGAAGGGANGNNSGNQTTEEERRPESVIYLSVDKKRLIAAPDDGSVESKTLSAAVFNKIIDFKVSPDGEYVAYIADQDIAGQYALYVAEIDEDEPVKVSHPMQSFSDVYDFEWSPNSETLAYRADEAVDQRPSLYVVNVDGSGFFEAARLAGYPDTVFVNDGYAWSPDGHYLAWLMPYEFNSDRDISLWSLDTRTQAQATFNNITFDIPGVSTDRHEIESFKWSPDSQQIAIRSDRFMNNNDQYGIVVAPAAANSPARVANGRAGNFAQIEEYHWSPDSQYMAQSVVQFPNDDIQVGINSYHIASSLSERLITTTSFGELRWAHNSNRLAFVAGFDSDTMSISNELELIIYHVGESLIDDINHDLVVNESLSDDDYIWSPDDSQIAYLSERAGSKYAYLVSTDDSADAMLLESTQGNTVDSLNFSSDSQQLGFLSMNEGSAFHPGNWFVFNKQGEQVWMSDEILTYESTQKMQWASDNQKLVYSAMSTASNEDKLVSIDLETFERLDITDDASTDIEFDYAEESLVEEEEED